jgi:hypothetical protein
MQRVLFLVLVAAGAFVWLTGSALPSIVASHFGRGGVATGFAPKEAYLGLMLTFVVAVPLLLALSARLVGVLPPRLINLPHREYWLAPQRRAATLDALSAMSVQFALVLAVFLCFVHWLVVRANAARPPRLEETPFIAGLALFGIITMARVLLLLRRFNRVP